MLYQRLWRWYSIVLMLVYCFVIVEHRLWAISGCDRRNMSVAHPTPSHCWPMLLPSASVADLDEDQPHLSTQYYLLSLMISVSRLSRAHNAADISESAVIPPISTLSSDKTSQALTPDLRRDLRNGTNFSWARSCSCLLFTHATDGYRLLNRFAESIPLLSVGKTVEILSSSDCTFFNLKSYIP